jgi:hypothetical protein
MVLRYIYLVSEQLEVEELVAEDAVTLSECFIT